jgi:hypothetical protein
MNRNDPRVEGARPGPSSIRTTGENACEVAQDELADSARDGRRARTAVRAYEGLGNAPLQAVVMDASVRTFTPAGPA